MTRTAYWDKLGIPLSHVWTALGTMLVIVLSEWLLGVFAGHREPEHGEATNLVAVHTEAEQAGLTDRLQHAEEEKTALSGRLTESERQVAELNKKVATVDRYNATAHQVNGLLHELATLYRDALALPDAEREEKLREAESKRLELDKLEKAHK